MSRQSTGLGWSAEANYLLQPGHVSIGVIQSIGGSSFPNQPIPDCGGTATDFAANAIWAYYDSPFGGAVAAGSGQKVLVFVTPGSLNFVSASRIDSNGFYFLSYVRTGGPTPIPVETPSGNPINTHDSTTGLYYASVQSSSLNDTSKANPDIPVFSSIRDGLDAVSVIQQHFYKLNDGYAVTCIAQWYTPEGTELISPVLISTIPLATAISTNGSTPSENMSEFSFLLDGARFYMTLIGGNSEDITSDVPYADLRQFAAAAPSKVFRLIASSSFANIVITDAPDPYGENTEEEGGDGEELEDDPVEEETLPVPSVAGHGFCTIYVPSSQELGQMASYLWSGSFDVTQVIKLFSNPMDSILGLSAVPVDLVGTSEQIYLGGVALTGITMPKYTGRTSVKVDFGTVTVPERWGSYLDYAPYTDFSIYLPFIGIKPIKADDIMGKTISLMYAIDILSGGCVAYLRPAGGSVLYEWSGQCALQIPITGRNYDNVFQSAMSVVTATIGAVAAPASAPVLAGSVASAAVQAAASKPHIERSGTVNGITGFLGQLRPYLIRTIPEAYIPNDQNKFIGYPAYIDVNLAYVQGYNEVDSIHMENVTATGAELEEIESILKGGVIF